jgi:TfoX/Sxy family transcriptional regulator of competence genes
MNLSMPKADENSKTFFMTVVPDDPRVSVRPMFGNLAAFVNGNMFFCLLGDDVAVRLPEQERADLLKHEGASQFEPRHGRPMREYITIPSVWQEEPEKLEEWVIRSFSWVSDMPVKQAKPRKKREEVVTN